MFLFFRNLKGIFKHHLWKESSKDLHLTFIASSVDVGYRRPVIPTEKDGVVLQLGSNSNFSEELQLICNMILIRDCNIVKEVWFH